MLAEWRLANPADDAANDEPPEEPGRVPDALQHIFSGEFALETKPRDRQPPTRITDQ